MQQASPYKKRSLRVSILIEGYVLLNYKVSTLTFLLTLTLSLNPASSQAIPEVIAACEQALKSGDYQQAESICVEQLKKSESTSQLPQTLQLRLSLIDIYHALGKTELEESELARVARHINSSQSSEVTYRWNRQMGRLAYFKKQLEKAKNYLYKGLEIAQQTGNQLWISKSLNDVGLIESQLSNYKESLTHYKNSLAIKRQQGDGYAIGTTLNNIGLNYTKLENYSKAVEFYENALSAFLSYTEQAQFDRRVFDNINHLYEDLAIAYSQLDNQVKESFYEKKTLESIAKKNSPRQQARALINIAKLELQSEKPKSALVFLDRAAALQSMGQFDLRLELALEESKTFVALEDFENAITHANAGLIIAEQKGDHLVMSDLYQVLSTSYQIRDIHTAFHYLQLHTQSRETYLKQKFDSQLNKIQLKIENQQVEHQLMAEKVANAENQAKIQRLTHWTLLTVMLLILCFAIIFIVVYKRFKERQVLLQSIKSHQQQLMMLDDKFGDLNQTKVAISSTTDPKQNLREVLVNTMLNVIAIWEKHTGSNKIELAEQSKLWTVSIDNGNLRTRSLDKYLSLDKIPANPKWRNVAGTCHFVLSDETLDAGARNQLKKDLDSVMLAVKTFSLSAQQP